MAWAGCSRREHPRLPNESSISGGITPRPSVSALPLFAPPYLPIAHSTGSLGFLQCFEPGFPCLDEISAQEVLLFLCLSPCRCMHLRQIKREKKMEPTQHNQRAFESLLRAVIMGDADAPFLQNKAKKQLNVEAYLLFEKL